MPLKLPVASVVALLGPAEVRSQVCGALDEDTARCAGGHGGLRGDPSGRSARRPGAGTGWTRCAPARRTSCWPSACTAGLGSAGRRLVLSALRGLAGAGATVVVDDEDPVAVLAVADAVLRVSATDGVRLEPLADAQALQPLLS